jgi:hypothetical protein
MIKLGFSELITTKFYDLDNNNSNFIFINDFQIKEVYKRYEYVTNYLQCSRSYRSEKSVRDCIDYVSIKINDEKPPDTRTLRRWVKNFISCDNDFRFLVPKKGKSKKYGQADSLKNQN